MDFDLDLRTTTLTAVRTAPAPVVTETVRVIPNSVAREHLAKPVEQWNWTDLRDYIVGEIEKVHGPQVRDALKESGIVKAFISRWGIEKAHAIAVAAFEVHGGWWRNAPVSISRFARGSDPYFACVIASNLS